MVEAGDAVQDKVHTSIYEEITQGERDQGYMTRNMVPLDPIGRKRSTRTAKVRLTEAEQVQDSATTPSEE
jgi:hypothetical protein